MARNVILVDQRGISARFPLVDFPEGLYRMCDGIKVAETGQVLKPCRHYRFPVYEVLLPWARTVHAQLRCNYDLIGSRARVFRLGLKADNGFSIPSQDVIDKLYVEVATDHPTQLGV